MRTEKPGGVKNSPWFSVLIGQHIAYHLPKLIVLCLIMSYLIASYLILLYLSLTMFCILQANN